MGLLDNKPAPSPGLMDPPTKPSGLSGLIGEYLRRSGRNLASGAGDAVDWLAQGAKAGAEPTLALMRGDDLDQPLLPTPESGGRSRLGAVASGLNPHLIPGAAPAGALGIFGGAKSKTANPAALQQAKSLIAGGADPEAVRQQTGWTRGFDGEWKYEISDHRAEVKVNPKTGNPELYHPELRRAYPDLMEKTRVKLFHGPEGNLARVDPVTHEIGINASLPPARWTDALLHEMQHSVQDLEGFSTGAAPSHPGILAFSQAERDLLRKQHLATMDQYAAAFDAWKADRLAENPKRFGRMKPDDLRDMFERVPGNETLARQREMAADELGWMDTPEGARWYAHQAYERAMGEAEARETQIRQRLKPAERRAIPPYRHPAAVPPHRLIDMRLLQTPDDPPPALGGLLNRTLGPSPEAKGTLASLLGIGLLPKDAE